MCVRGRNATPQCHNRPTVQGPTYPAPNVQQLQIMQRIRDGKWSFPSNVPVSEGCKALLRRMLELMPARRATMEQVRRALPASLTRRLSHS
jgi:hypothetical protein